jgi:hypothetical protein
VISDGTNVQFVDDRRPPFFSTNEFCLQLQFAVSNRNERIKEGKSSGVDGLGSKGDPRRQE